MLSDQAENVGVDWETIKTIGAVVGAITGMVTLSEKLCGYIKRTYQYFKNTKSPTPRIIEQSRNTNKTLTIQRKSKKESDNYQACIPRNAMRLARRVNVFSNNKKSLCALRAEIVLAV